MPTRRDHSYPRPVGADSGADDAEAFRLGLRGLEAQGLYRVRHHDAGWVNEMRGTELAALTVSLPSPGTCALISDRRLP